MTDAVNPILEAAIDWRLAGYSVVPVSSDGSKRPAVPWKAYQSELADGETIGHWFRAANGTDYGLGVVCGAVSGELEMFEFEGRAIAEGIAAQMTTAMAQAEASILWALLASGYAELTPSGGIHIFYRVDGPARGNTKLARRPSTPAELEAAPGAKVQVLIETRGEGGYVAIAPTPGTHHLSGNPWRVLAGSPKTIPLITVEQRDLLFAVASTLDAMPAPTQPMLPEPEPSTSSNAGNSVGGLRPGDDYNERAEWSDILEGWTRVRRLGNGWAWRRPGKDDFSISATTGQADDKDRLYVFSTSTEFESERPYDKIGAYAALHHGGDITAATQALKATGKWGKDAPAFGLTPMPTPVHVALPSGVSPIRPQVSAGSGTEQVSAATPAAGSLFDGNTVTQLVPAPDSPVMTERQTDDGNANSLIDRHGDDLRFCHERNRWLTWDVHRWSWQPRSGGQAREYAKDNARRLPDTKETRVWRNKSLSALGTTNTLTQAATDPRVVVPLTQLDAEAWSLNTPAGVVDLQTGKLGDLADHSLHTRSTTVAPDPDADLTVWLNFLNVTFGGDQELIGYMQRLVGYSATGYIGPHILPFAYGSGGNGKGVFLEAIGKVLGDYATTGPSAFLMAKSHVGHDTEIARLSGARMVLCSEVNEVDRFDEAKVKQLTGGDTLTARFMRQDFFSFAPTHHLWLMGNHKPTVTTGGRSFWRRCRLIPFLHEVPKDQEIDDLQGILARDHGPAILSWIIAGAVEFAKGGSLREPESVIAATAEYASEQDTVQRFVSEMGTLSESDSVRTEVGVLAAAYIRWCEELGEEPVSGKRLSMDLANRYGVRSGRDMRRRWYLGIALENTVPSFMRGSGQAQPEPWGEPK